MKRPREFDLFTKLVDQVLAVPHAVIQKRVEEHRKQVANNPNRPGPKPKRKIKSSASGREATSKN